MIPLGQVPLCLVARYAKSAFLSYFGISTPHALAGYSIQRFRPNIKSHLLVYFTNSQLKTREIMQKILFFLARSQYLLR